MTVEIYSRFSLWLKNMIDAYIFAINKLLPSKALSDQLQSDLIELFEKYSFADPTKYRFPKDWEAILTEQSNSYDFYSFLVDSPYIKA